MKTCKIIYTQTQKDTQRNMHNYICNPNRCRLRLSLHVINANAIYSIRFQNILENGSICLECLCIEQLGDRGVLSNILRLLTLVGLCIKRVEVAGNLPL